MNKNQLTDSIAKWLKIFLDIKFSKNYETIKIFKPKRNLNLISDEMLSSISGISSWEFKPDIFAAMTKTDGSSDLIIVNRSISSISLKEIGEMNCYAQLSAPIIAMIVSPQSGSSEVNGILLEDEMSKRILDYGGKHPISIVGWNESLSQPEINSILPIEMQSFFRNI